MTEYKDMGKQPAAIEVARRDNGEILLSSPYPPRPLPESIPGILKNRAELHADRPLLAERSSEGVWQSLSYGDAWQQVCRAALSIRNRKLGQDDCIAILSPRSFDHFSLAFGAQLAGVPVTPVSAPYSLLSKDHAKLIYIIGLLRPSILLVDSIDDYQRPLRSLLQAGLLDDVLVLSRSRMGLSDDHHFQVECYEDWLSDSPPDNWTDTALAEISHDTIARYMFTSGSTGMPKGVIYSQGMMCSAIGYAGGLTRTADEAESVVPAGSRVLEWMPWSHTGAGVMRLNGVIAGGGTIYFDTGRPVPGEYQDTLRNMREVKPTALSGAPVGYVMLAEALEQDDELNELVFSNINSLGFGSAAMAPTLFERLQALCVKATGARVGVTSGFASTEVIGACNVYWPMENTGTIGLPIPGVSIKLVPNGSKLEFRIKGGTVTSGYFRDPEKTRESFDDEGYFKMGDAVRFVDADQPEAGLAFDGRVAEEFKLLTGTWVSAGTLRTQVISAASPFLRDVIICGLNQSYVSILAWPNIDACSKFLQLDDRLSVQEKTAIIVNDRDVVAEVRRGLAAHNEQFSGSSTRIDRFLLLQEPPSMDGNELTEKGYINQRATQERRADLVDLLYSESHIPDDVHVVFK